MLKKTIWEMGRDSLEEYRTKGKLPLIVVLDNVRSLLPRGRVMALRHQRHTPIA